MTLFARVRQVFDAPALERPRDLSIRQGTPEFDYLVARGTLDTEDQDLGNGLEHLASLLAADPARPEWLELLDRYLARVGGDWRQLLPETHEGYYASEALRALLWAREGRLGAAIERIGEVMAVKTDARYLEGWVLDWLEAEGAVEGLAAEQLLRLLSSCLERYGEYAELPERDVRCLRRLAACGARVDRAALPTELRPMVEMTLAGLYRRAGLWDEGHALLIEAERSAPSWHLATALGLLYRARDQVTDAARAFRRALEHDPSDVSARLEAGDMYLERGRWDEALTWYGEALELQPEQGWARASMLWASWRRAAGGQPHRPANDVPIPDALFTLEQAGVRRAGQLFDAFRPYVGFLPRPGGVAQTLLDQLSGEALPAADGALQIELPRVEPPSLLLAIAMRSAQLGRPPARVTLRYGQVDSPDPREPVETIVHLLWRRDGEMLVPRLPHPPTELALRVAELAARPYAPARDWAAASRLAASLGAEAAPQLLACCLYPTLPPPGASDDPLDWIPRVQQLTAFVIAQLPPGPRTVEGNWEDSPRRGALLSLLLGPRDWATVAAILALARLVAHEPVLALDVGQAFERLDRSRDGDAPQAHDHALLLSWLSLPHLVDEEREALGRRLSALFAEDDDGDEG